MVRDFAKIAFYFFAAAAVAITIFSYPDTLLSGALTIGVLIFFYLFPTCVAAHRKHNNEGAIFAMNLLLG